MCVCNVHVYIHFDMSSMDKTRHFNSQGNNNMRYTIACKRLVSIVHIRLEASASQINAIDISVNKIGPLFEYVVFSVLLSLKHQGVTHYKLHGGIFLSN